MINYIHFARKITKKILNVQIRTSKKPKLNYFLHIFAND